MTKSYCIFIPFFHCTINSLPNKFIYLKNIMANKNPMLIFGFVSVIQIYLINFGGRLKIVFHYIFIGWAIKQKIKLIFNYSLVAKFRG